MAIEQPLSRNASLGRKKNNLIDLLRQIRWDVMWLPRMIKNIYILGTRCSHVRILTYKSLVKSVKKRNDVCHVIAVGSSALDAFKANIVRPDDFVIGLNFAAFLPYKFDVYFFESSYRHGAKYYQWGLDCVALFVKRKNNIAQLVYKNSYFTDPYAMMREMPDLPFSLVPDRLLMYTNIRRLFAKPTILMPQYMSSITAAIMLAYHAGFKNIVVHGLDFSGPHIYHDKELQRQIGIEPPSPYVTNDVKHPTGNAMELFCPALVKTMTEKGVGIFCASPQSNFKKYAKLWQPELFAGQDHESKSSGSRCF
jgi:hypothetical protein